VCLPTRIECTYVGGDCGGGREEDDKGGAERTCEEGVDVAMMNRFVVFVLCAALQANRCLPANLIHLTVSEKAN
jgi:hypothetical protein